MRSPQRSMTLICWSLLVAFVAMTPSHAQGVEVSAKIIVHTTQAAAEKRQKDLPSAANVVVWLSPLKPVPAPSLLPARQTPYRLVQKNKMFTPHLLVVPTGASVQFPNEDPFFHNVFSLFNGKRFDLGLYESGASRSVRFDREGVSYIFCNIHPEMGAVILSLNTPYYGISSANGAISIQNVPPGSYRLSVWSENGQSDPETSEHIVQVSADPMHLGNITLRTTADPLMNHKNKFGEDYKPDRETHY